LNNKSKNITLPLLVLRGINVFPKQKIIFNVSREISKSAISFSTSDYDSKIICIAQKNLKEDNPDKDNIYDFGTLCSVKKIKSSQQIEGIMTVEVVGLSRFKPKEILKTDNLFFAEGKIVNSVGLKNSDKNNIILKQFKDNIIDIPKILGKNFSANIRDQLLNISTLEQNDNAYGEIVDALTFSFPIFTLDAKQAILKELNTIDRISIFLENLKSTKAFMEIDNEIDVKVRKKMDEVQKEYYLRERLKSIKEELGDIKPVSDESTEIRKTHTRSNINIGTIYSSGFTHTVPGGSGSVTVPNIDAAIGSRDFLIIGQNIEPYLTGIKETRKYRMSGIRRWNNKIYK